MNPANESSTSFPSNLAGSAPSSNLPRLGPAWRSGSQGARRGFQPPPAADSSSAVTRTGLSGDADGKASDQPQSLNRNSFSALMMDMEEEDNLNSVKDDAAVATSSYVSTRLASSTGGSFSSRSEALRSAPATGFNRSLSSGDRGSAGGSLVSRSGGRSLRELASLMNTNSGPVTGRGSRVGGASSSGSGLEEGPSFRTSSFASSIDYEKKVIRYTREKLLSMRPKSTSEKMLTHLLKGVEGSIWFSKECLDPVCWDNFDPDEIWAEVPREKRVNTNTKAPSDRLSRRDIGDEDIPRRGSVASVSGRWERGVALPPPDDRTGRSSGGNKNDEADNPDDLWDDPLSPSLPMAASDFSAFGGSLDEEPKVSNTSGDVFDLQTIAEAARKFEEDFHRENGDKTDQNILLSDKDFTSHPVDPSRPLASVGTTIHSGSGDDVNVFEDFDDPTELVDDALSAAIKAGEPTESLSSRLMQMIGVSAVESGFDDKNQQNLETKQEPESSSLEVGPVPVFSTIPVSVSKNPWGDSVRSTHVNTDTIHFSVRMQEAEYDKRKREEELELLRLRQEEEEKRRALIQAQQAEVQSRQQTTVSNTQQQGHSQVELILMERIGSILENLWGRSDMMSILSTLHAEDSRVIPLLSSVEALRALILRHPRRIGIVKDPAFGSDMAVLLITNSQFQQQQQAAQELQRRQVEQQQLQAAAIAKAKADAEARAREAALKPVIISDAPWYYADPQGNIQGPFGGEEMRQWLEAGYFKGDLPISQNPSSNFRTLASIFPDLGLAFRSAEPSIEEKLRIRLVEEEARAQEEAILVAERERQAQENARIQAENEERARIEEAAQSSMMNQIQSEKLKMMLGLGGVLSTSSVPLAPQAVDSTRSVSSKKAESIISSRGDVSKSGVLEVTSIDSKSPTPAMPAWGGAGSGISVQKLSVSEIQMEEARAAAVMAQQREKSRPSGSGWANVAASGGTNAWAGGVAVKPVVPAVPAAPSLGSSPYVSSSVSTATSMQQARAKQQMAVAAAQKQILVQQVKSSAQNSLDEFGASGKMTPTLEAWCKDQMRKLNGNDDLTLIAFCMTLTDPTEIRQYLTAYLGSTPQVTSFATEFINRKNGSNQNQETWESTVNSKKGRKKKTSA